MDIYNKILFLHNNYYNETFCKFLNKLNELKKYNNEFNHLSLI